MTRAANPKVATAGSTAEVPAVSSLVTSPLRNRIRVRLGAPVEEVWALVGDHTKLPEYSAGIARTDLVTQPSGQFRVCHFRAAPGVPEGSVVRERVRWYALGRGYATSAEPGNGFGLENDLGLVTVEPDGTGTLFTWDQHYDCEMLDELRASFNEGLADIANRLIQRFGGEVVERYVDR